VKTKQQTPRPQYRSLLAYRLAHKLSQREAAARFGISQAAWARYENQVTRPKNEIARLLVHAGIPLDVLMGLGS
jgi:transcriptional regulator with XRE-family HTH domain